MGAEKLCRDCSQTKPASDFTSYEYRNSYATKDGTVKTYGGTRLATYCKKCMGRRSVRWAKNNPERFRAYQNAYYRAKRSKLTKRND